MTDGYSDTPVSYTHLPNAVTETVNEDGVVVRAIDKDVLMQEISTTVVEGREERYQFTWPDKKKAVSYTHLDVYKRQGQQHFHQSLQ